MRILYGVHGYGRGHATRSAAVLPFLARHHQVLVVAGGDAFPSLNEFPIVRIPTLGFAYGAQGRRCNLRTAQQNFSGMLDLKMRGPVFQMVRQVFDDFSPDVVIADAEAWTHHVAASLKTPRISFDHIGLLAHGRPRVEWPDRVKASLDAACYRSLVGKPDRMLISSFYPVDVPSASVQVVATLMRPAVREQTPRTGEHLVAYFNRGHDQLTPRLLRELEAVGVPIHLYGSPRRGRDGNITYCSLSNLPFLEDLASCRAVLSTAGNQLVGEAIHLGKPLLVIPEHCVEQRLNAAAVERLGIGERTTWRRFNAGLVRTFLDRGDRYRAAIPAHARDGLAEALVALHRFFGELVPNLANPPLVSQPESPQYAEVCS